MEAEGAEGAKRAGDATDTFKVKNSMLHTRLTAGLIKPQ